ncbi:MAG: hypothetical protein P9L99_19415 [Candidatus Lernaella stagnicola]|nr:hypothetical protein [Candidatus Lernaella stagnicola]
MKKYLLLHKKCGEIVAESVSKDYSQLHGQTNLFLCELESWIEIIKPSREHHLLFLAAQEYQYAALALTQGLYRQAFKGLRLVLELCLQALFLSTNQLMLREWFENRKDTIWSEITDDTNGVLSVRFAKAFFPTLEQHVCQFRKNARKNYRKCSEYVHGNIKTLQDLPDTLAFNAQLFKSWHETANEVALVVSFSLALRYLKEFDSKELNIIESKLLDRLGHIEAIRLVFDEPQGGLND